MIIAIATFFIGYAVGHTKAIHKFINNLPGEDKADEEK